MLRRDLLKVFIKGSVAAVATTATASGAGETVSLIAQPVKKEIITNTEIIRSMDFDNDCVDAIERQIMRYVKRTGGFRKGLTPEEINTAKALLFMVGRTDPIWADPDHQIGNYSAANSFSKGDCASYGY